MREVDEILLGYPDQSPGVRRYLLRRLERIPFPVDPGAAHALLGSADAGETAGFAWLAEAVFFERREEDRLVVRAREGVAPTGVAEADLVAAAMGLLSPLLELATSSLGAPETRSLGLGLLGRLRIPRTIEFLARRDHDLPPRDRALAAGVLGGDAAAEFLAGALPDASEPDPVALACLRRAPSEATLEILRRAAGAGDPAREGAALALEGFGRFDVDDLLGGLLDPGRPYVYLQAVESLGRLGSDGARRRILAELDSDIRPSLRAACVRAAIPPDRPVAPEVVERGLAEDDARLGAAALDGLLRRADRPPELVARCRDLVDAPDPRLAARAARVVLGTDPERARARLVGLLRSGDRTSVLEAVHALGDLSGDGVRKLLQAVATRAGPGVVRLTALRSLGRHLARGDAGPELLLPVLRGGDPASRQVVARYLSAGTTGGGGRVAGALADAARREDHPPTREVLAEALGLLGADEGAGVLAEMAAEGGAVGAAAAAALATGLPETAEASELAAASAPEVRVHAFFRDWTLRGDGAGALTEWARDQAPAARREALAVARRMAEGARLAARAPGMAGLRERLVQVVDGSSEELSALVERTGQLDGLASELGGLFATREGSATLGGFRVEEDLVDAAVSVEAGALPAPRGPAAAPRTAPAPAPSPPAAASGPGPAVLAAAALALGLLLRFLLG